MQGIALHRFGGASDLTFQNLPVPHIGPTDILIKVAFAGVGEWDTFEREGGYAQMLGMTPAFPYILGSEGSGVVCAIGEQVHTFTVGDPVYGVSFLNPKGGFYAQYASVNAGYAAHIPHGLTVEEAGVIGGVGLTALRGIDDILKVKAGESIMIFGASGGVGHLAVQLAKLRGMHVLAVASGQDGVALTQRLDADMSVDGRRDNVQAAIRQFAPNGLDAALLTAGSETMSEILQVVRSGGRIAYPFGIQPEPSPLSNREMHGYYGQPDPEIVQKLNGLIEAHGIRVHVAQSFPLENAAEAHLALQSHYVGKLALKVSP
jgi:NADPH:quinone reductase-like Zn-dependent oxidoreductase